MKNFKKFLLLGFVLGFTCSLFASTNKPVTNNQPPGIHQSYVHVIDHSVAQFDVVFEASPMEKLQCYLNLQPVSFLIAKNYRKTNKKELSYFQSTSKDWLQRITENRQAYHRLS